MAWKVAFAVPQKRCVLSRLVSLYVAFADREVSVQWFCMGFNLDEIEMGPARTDSPNDFCEHLILVFKPIRMGSL